MRRNFVNPFCILAGLLALGVALEAVAAPVIRVEDVGAGVGVVVPDQGAGDIMSGSPGNVVVGTNVGQYLGNAVTALSAPGSITHTDLSLNSGGAGTLQIAIADSAFSAAGLGSFVSQIGGQWTAPAGSTLVAQTWVNAGGSLINLGSATFVAGPLGSIGAVPGGSLTGLDAGNATFSPGAFLASNTINNIVFSGAYSMFSIVTVNFTGAGQVGFSLTMQGPVGPSNASDPVPEPGSILLWNLLAAAGAGAGLLRRRVGS
jgi:hypothetical protein